MTALFVKSALIFISLDRSWVSSGIACSAQASKLLGRVVCIVILMVIDGD
jgi:hypothetical protein